MGMVTKEVKDKVVAQISAELFVKGKISESEYIKDVMDIFGNIPPEYSPEKVKQKRCWM